MLPDAKRLVSRLLLLALLVAPMHAIVALIRLAEGPEARGVLTQIRAIDETLREAPQVLFLAASFNWWSSHDDQDRSKISEMLNAELPGVRVGSIDHAAYHVGVFNGVCGRIGRAGFSPPRVLVVSVNPRSFSYHWRARPRWQFDDVIRGLEGKERTPAVTLRRVLERPLRTFGLVLDGSGEYLAQQVFDGETLVGSVAQVEASSVPRDHVINRYLEPITPDNERALELVALARCAGRGKYATLFFIPPVNHEYCEAVYGTRATVQIRRNVAMLRRILGEEGFEVMDLSELAPSSHFAHGIAPDEHLKQAGRLLVAQRLAVAIRRLLSPAELAPASDHPPNRGSSHRAG